MLLTEPQYNDQQRSRVSWTDVVALMLHSTFRDDPSNRLTETAGNERRNSRIKQCTDGRNDAQAEPSVLA